MKKLLLILAIGGIITACGEKIIESSKLQKINGRYYEINQTKVFTGKTIQKYLNGKLKEEFNYKDGVPDGIQKKWYENGQLKEESNYKDGKIDGFMKSYYENGQLKYEGNYKDNQFVGDYKEYYDNKNIKTEIDYTNNIFIEYSKNGNFKVKRKSNEETLLYNKTNDLMIPFIIDDIKNQELTKIKKNNRYGYIDKSGKIIVPIEYDYTGDFSEGLVIVGEGDKAGYFNEKGELVLPIIYDIAQPFKEGLAVVKNSDYRYGVINTKGKIVIPIKVGSIGKINYKFFKNGFYIVDQRNDKSTLFDQNGNKIVIN